MTKQDPASLGSLPYERGYRLGVGIILTNKQGCVFVGKRADGKANQWTQEWQMPQGGIDENEFPAEAMWRELQEETGTNNARLIKESSMWFEYHLPLSLHNRSWGGRYHSQRQKWFLLEFLGEDAEIHLDSQGGREFVDWKWVLPLDTVDLIVDFKKDMYKKIISEFFF